MSARGARRLALVTAAIAVGVIGFPSAAHASHTHAKVVGNGQYVVLAEGQAKSRSCSQPRCSTTIQMWTPLWAIPLAATPCMSWFTSECPATTSSCTFWVRRLPTQHAQRAT